MYSMVYLEKEAETPENVIYRFGPKDELSGRIMLKKDADPAKNAPEELTPVNSDKPGFFFQRASMRLAKYRQNGEFPEADTVTTEF